MMADIRLNHKGIGRVLRSDEVGEAVRGAAETVASNAASAGYTVYDIDIAGKAVIKPLADYVRVFTYETDREAAAVTLAHPAGVGMQATHGVLTAAAVATGLDVS